MGQSHRMTISITKSMKEEMDKLENEGINWSLVARWAFQKKIDAVKQREQKRYEPSDFREFAWM